MFNIKKTVGIVKIYEGYIVYVVAETASFLFVHSLLLSFGMQRNLHDVSFACSKFMFSFTDQYASGIE